MWSVNLLSMIIVLWSVASASILYPLVDVKGNGAIRQIRLLYDIYDTTTTNVNPLAPPPPPPSILSAPGQSERHASLHKLHKTMPRVLYPWSSGPPYWVDSYGRQSRHYQNLNHQNKLPDVRADYWNPQHWLEYGNDHASNMVHKYSLKQRLKMKGDVPAHYLFRDRPLYAEVDFVPRYLPQWTRQVAISVTLPAQIRGRPWVLGYHQEDFPLPPCRLCTNLDQSYTIPVTIFLPDDGWCPEGRVQTIWKIEAIQQSLDDDGFQESSAEDKINRPRGQSKNRLSQSLDQSDLTLAYGYDDLKQLLIKNDRNSSKCRDRNEVIVNNI